MFELINNLMLLALRRNFEVFCTAILSFRRQLGDLVNIVRPYCTNIFLFCGIMASESEIAGSKILAKTIVAK